MCIGIRAYLQKDELAYGCIGILIRKIAQIKDYGQLSLKVPNVEFDFDVSVSNCMLSTYTSKSKSTIGTHLHTIIRPLLKFPHGF